VKALLWICLILVLLAAGVQTPATAQNAMPEIRFPEPDQSKTSAAPQAPAPQHDADQESSAGWVHPSPPHPHAVKTGPASPADQLNRTELNYLLGGGRGAPRASIR
jgi:hypothetical protein